MRDGRLEASGHNWVEGQGSGPRIDKKDDEEDQYDAMGNKIEKAKKENGFFELQRGFATIPLPGIDVPFHSRYLWAGVMPFRACAFSFYYRM